MRPVRHQVRLAALRILGRAYPRPAAPQSPRHILLIRPDHLGDVLFLTPALHALRCALPDARLTLLAGPWGAEAVRGNADVDALVTCPFPGFERRPKASFVAPYRLLAVQARALRAGSYDAAVILRFDHWWGAWLAAAARIPMRIGYDWPETRAFLTDAIAHAEDRHEVLQNARLLSALVTDSDSTLGRLRDGVTADPRPDRAAAGPLHLDLGPLRYSPSASDRAQVTAWLAERGVSGEEHLAAIHAGAGAPVKQWPVRSWTRVAAALSEQGLRIIVTGSEEEKALAGAIAEGAPGCALNAAGQTTLGQLAALYERCLLVMGSDSGPLHLAVAVGAPTVHLYGPVSARKFGPWGDPARHIALVTDWTCAPCDRLDWPTRALAQHACMAAIPPEAVLSAARQLIEHSKRPSDRQPAGRLDPPHPRR